jgi:hypothetical protein
MASRTSLLHHLGSSLAALGTWRPLLPREREFLAAEFGDSLDLSRIRIAGGGHPLGRIAWQPAAALIQLGDGCFEAGDPERPIATQHLPILAHEALHVWQRVHKHSRFGVSIDGLLLGALRGRDAYIYDTSLSDPTALLTEFLHGNIEQQGQIFEDYVRSNVSVPRARASKFQCVAEYVRHKARP